MKLSRNTKFLPLAALLAGAAALAVAVFLAYRGKSLIVVALSSSAAVLAAEAVMRLAGLL